MTKVRRNPIAQAIEFIGEHPFATGLLAILGIAGFILSVVGFQQDRADAETTSQQMADAGEKLEEIEQNTAAPWKGKPNFKGDWDEDRAFERAWPRDAYAPGSLPEAPGGSIESTSPVLERSFFVPLRDTDARLLLTSLSEGECNACGVQLSLFVFKKDDGTWYLDQEARNFVRSGRRGVLNFGDGLDELTVWNLGPDRFGFVIPTSSWYQGEATEGYRVFAFIADELFEVFEGNTSTYFAGLGKEEAMEAGFWFEKSIEIAFDPSESDFGFSKMIATYSDTEAPDETRITIAFDSQQYGSFDIRDVSECVIRQGRPKTLQLSDCR